MHLTSWINTNIALFFTKLFYLIGSAQGASVQPLTISDPSNVVGMSWHCYSYEESPSGLDYDECAYAIEHLKEEISPITRSWLSPNQGTYMTWSKPNGKCVINLGCTIPLTQGQFGGSDITNKLGFLKVICPIYGGKGYLPTADVGNWSLMWYVEIKNPARQPTILGPANFTSS